MQTHVVVGGTSGLGYAIAHQLVPERRVIVLGDRKNEVEETAASLSARGRAQGYVCDVADHEMVAEVFRQIVGEHGYIHGVAHCAAMWTEGPLEDTPPEVIRRVTEVNTQGVLYVTREVIWHMKAQGGGNIVYVGAMAGERWAPGVSIYGGGKAGNTHTLDSYASEVGPFGIKLMTIHPGAIGGTRLQERVGKKFLDDTYLDPEAVAAQIVYMLMLRRNDPMITGIRIVNERGRF